LFADSADIQVYPPKFRTFQPSKQDIQSARVIFCPSHEFERFLEEYSGSIRARVLILGNSDRDFEYFDESLIPSSVNQVFVQNLSSAGEKSRVLPIGIENLRLGTNGLIKYFDKKFIDVEKLSKVLVGPFSMTHSDRDFYNHPNLELSERITVLRGRITPRAFADISSSFKFVAAPRGNGIDTHRFWETLYRGSYPIVNKNDWSYQVKNLKIPLIEIDSWQDDFITSIPATMPRINPREIDSLWWPFWKEQIKLALN
jgi:hypothetical protein